MNWPEFLLILVTGGTLTKIIELIIDVIKSKRANQSEIAAAHKIEADTGEIIVKSAGEVIQHYKQMVEQLRADVDALKKRVSELENELINEQKLRQLLELNLGKK